MKQSISRFLIVGFLGMAQFASGRSVFEEQAFLPFASVQVGQPVAVSGPLWDGTTFDITQESGKVVVIDFWATWCGPCTSMSRDLKALYAKYQNRDVEFVGVSLDYRAQDLEQYVRIHSIAWPQIYHTTRSGRSKATGDFNVSSIPALFVVGKDGTLQSGRLSSTSQVDRAIARVLNMSP